MNGIPPEDLQICLDVLQRVADDPGSASTHDRFKALVAKIHREGRRLDRRTAGELRTQHDRELRSRTGMMRRKRREPAESAGAGAGIAAEVPGTKVPGTQVSGTKIPGTRHPA